MIIKLAATYWMWITNERCAIQDKNSGKIIPYKPNFVQKALIDHRAECIREKRPIRQIALKSRKHGISTEAQAWNYHVAKTSPNTAAMTFAQSDLDTKKIFKIARRIHLESGRKVDASHRIVFNPGVGESTYECRTIGGHGGGRGDTVHHAHFSEAGFYEREVEQGAEAFSAMLNSVPMSLETSVLIESTGYPGGKFHAMCKQAKEGEGLFKLFFFPWYLDPTATWAVEPGWKPTGLAAEIQRQFKLSDAQMRWYDMQYQQNVTSNDNPADIAKFRREFATTFEDCFLVASGRIFPQYSDMPIVDGGHVGTMTIGPEWEICGGMDYGAGGLHPNVHLWVAHNPDGPPRLVIDPSCKVLRESLQMYCRDPDTGDPIKGEGWDDAVDALRYVTTSRKMRGTVYVFKEYVEYKTLAHNDIARKIKTMTDRRMRVTVCPREEPQTNIDMTRFLGWPCIPWEAPKMPGRTSQGTVEDGINHLAALLTGNVEWFRPVEDKIEQVMQKVEECRGTKDRRPRRVWLTEKEQRLYRMGINRELRTEKGLYVDAVN